MIQWPDLAETTPLPPATRESGTLEDECCTEFITETWPLASFLFRAILTQQETVPIIPLMTSLWNKSKIMLIQSYRARVETEGYEFRSQK
jgi:hypothetical protein